MKVSIICALIACFFCVVQGAFSDGLYSLTQVNGKWVLTPGTSQNYIATALVNVSQINQTGWSTLDIQTNSKVEDGVQAFAAGYLEGALTAEIIYQSWTAQLEWFFNGTVDAGASAWLIKNDAWVRAQVANCSNFNVPECDYWYQIGLVLFQIDGMVLGYNEYCDSDKHFSYADFLYINADADLGDILSALYPSPTSPSPKQNMEKEHCSVLIKYSPEMQQIYHSHTTWAHYVNLLRTYKYYTFQFSHPSTSSKTVSFSSFPGFIPSGDDFFITDRGLIVTETTNDIFNMSLYKNVQINTVLYWLRVVVANRMANNGAEWVQIFGKYNSGTYNNQWQVTDTKLFTPGQPFVAGTLWILEQIPGYVMSEDVTDFLTTQGHFPSYNIPYFPFIYNISGYPSQYELYGDAYSYSSCPRANIFRRDQSKVVTLQDMQDIMRYNEYQTDPFSLGDSCNAVSARCDLNTTGVFAFGGLDCKVSDTTMIKNMTVTALSGPTTLTQPPFSWTGPFASIPHYGQPTTFDFDFVQMQPRTLE